MLFCHEFFRFLSNLAMGLTWNVPLFIFSMAERASRVRSTVLVYQTISFRLAWMLSPRDGGGNEAPGPRLRPLPIAGPLSCVLQYRQRHHAVSKRPLGTPRGCFKHRSRHK